MTTNETPIEDFLDDLMRRSHAGPRTTRRLLDEAGDHLFAAAAEFEQRGMDRVAAEREAVQRFGMPGEVLAGASRHAFVAMALEVARAAVLLGGVGLVAVGLSGGLVAIMNAAFGMQFVGGASVAGTGGHSITETAQDAVSLRVLAGVAGLVLVAGYFVLRRWTRPEPVLPAGLIDALGAAAFAAATVVLVGASIDQGVTGTGGHGVGFFLSGALIAVVGTVVFCSRATRALLTSHRRLAVG